MRLEPLAIAAVPAFLASIVEFVEAFTIVLAVGNTRGWRAPVWATLAAVITLAVVVLAFGAPLVVYHEQISAYFHLAVGLLLLLFGMRWLRKAILRFAGIIALHDEDLIYQREVAVLRAQGLSPARWDHVGFWISYKALLLEGVEVAFIVITLGSRGSTELTAAILGAAAAFVLTMIAGGLLRKPLTAVPENWMKFAVGSVMVAFGIFWGAEGFHMEWPLGPATLLVLLAVIGVASWLAVRMLHFQLPEGAVIADRYI
jgi:uncharacterized membrane protein